MLVDPKLGRARLVLLAIYTSSTFADYQLETQGTQSDDAKWNYFREDYLLQGFHAMWHEHYTKLTKLEKPFPRRVELFQYVHQQILRRYDLVFRTLEFKISARNVLSIHFLTTDNNSNDGFFFWIPKHIF